MNRAKDNKLKIKSIRKEPTGIKGLDVILHGGFPKNRTILLRGSPGSGKTILSIEFLYRGAINNSPGIYIGLEETIKDIKLNAKTLGWDLDLLEKEKKIFFIEAHIPPESILSGEFSLKGLLAIATSKAKEIGATRIVFDAMNVLLRLFEPSQKARAEILFLNQWIRKEKLTSILTVKPEQKGDAAVLEEFFESMSDCVIDLKTRFFNQVPTRRLRVVKYRGSSFGRNEYPYSIGVDGITIVPITNMALNYKKLKRKLSMGIAELDEMLSGGVKQGSALLISGLPGTGKTLFAAKFIEKNCAKGDKVLFFGLEESEDNIIINVASANIKLEPFRKSGVLKIITTFPESAGSEEHLVNLTNVLDEYKPKHLVIDSISALSRMGGREAAFDFLARLLNFAKERGITLFMLNQAAGEKNIFEISGNNISSMIDVVIFLNYHEYNGRTNRVLYILKTRGSNHSNQKVEFVISNEGITIEKPKILGGKLITGSIKDKFNKDINIQLDLIEKRIKFLEIALFKIDSRKIDKLDDIVAYNNLVRELAELKIRRNEFLTIK